MQKLNLEMSSDEAMLQAQVDNLNRDKGTLNETDFINCDICNNKGIIFKLKDNRIVVGDCSCRAKRKLVRSMKAMGINPQNISPYIATEKWQYTIKMRAKEYIEEEDTSAWFYIGGQSGAGKTLICYHIIEGIIEKVGGDFQFFSWRDVATELKSNVNDYGYYNQRIAPFKNCKLLYIDDLFKTGKGNTPTQADINLAFDIINSRYRANMPIIISSELTLNELIEVDEGIAGRIAERTKGSYVLSIAPDVNKNYRFNKGKD